MRHILWIFQVAWRFVLFDDWSYTSGRDIYVLLLFFSFGFRFGIVGISGLYNCIIFFQFVFWTFASFFFRRFLFKLLFFCWKSIQKSFCKAVLDLLLFFLLWVIWFLLICFLRWFLATKLCPDVGCCAFSGRDWLILLRRWWFIIFFVFILVFCFIFFFLLVNLWFSRSFRSLWYPGCIIHILSLSWPLRDIIVSFLTWRSIVWPISLLTLIFNVAFIFTASLWNSGPVHLGVV